ncbi:MAG TPA: thioredoxin-dependent thiol peroxidase [Candidatus Peribacteraceae bacterium]|nr:thioredoxin-dependent thiol peroxidase [Candidatus Peribacteraceae bacterium]
MAIAAGQKAPAWKAKDQDGIDHTLDEYRGSWLLLYFYPKDDTPGCTTEACNFRDNLGEIERNGLKLVGVSVDPVDSHRTFADKYELPFTLIADEDKSIVKAYDVWGKKQMAGKEYDGTFRTSFLIDPNGVIQKVYENVKPETHVEEILRDTKEIVVR